MYWFQICRNLTLERDREGHNYNKGTGRIYLQPFIEQSNTVIRSSNHFIDIISVLVWEAIITL